MGPPMEPVASTNLWVGNLAMEATEADLTELFAPYGPLDNVAAYTSRNYAFVIFKRPDHAKAAKAALHGFSLCGSPLKIEFARPAKPCKQLWVGGISQAVSKEEVEEEFLKYGKIEDFKFIRDRNTAFITFFRLEDASQAMRNMNGKRMGGDLIRVDFLRSQPLRREPWPDSRDVQFQGRGTGAADSHPIHKRQQFSQVPGGRRGEDQPSKVLWIGYPPSFHVDEQMLHNAMILFGEIENIRSFPSRNYSLVEFRSVEEARHAKDGLQGRLFNDPRISIMFSNNDLAQEKDFYPEDKGSGLDRGFSEHSFRPLQMEPYRPNHPMASGNFTGPAVRGGGGGILGPNMPMRPLGPHGRFESPVSGPELNEMATLSNYQDGNSKSIMGPPNWRRPSPPTLSPGMHSRHESSTWDAFDGNQFQRDSKRSRIDGPMPGEDSPFPLRKIDEHLLGDQLYGLVDGGLGNVQGKSQHSPVGLRGRGTAQVHHNNDYIWRGLIAKGGTPVCRARCVPLGKGVESVLPEVVNCSARTGLDMLTKHYAEAIGFEIIFFLPDSEDDFASYTEFLRYLGAKNRAGVAKFDDGTTLFLVPPSEFLTNVLSVSGPDRLYGVTLKFPQAQPQLYPPIAPQYDNHQAPNSQIDYSVMKSKDAWVPQMDYHRVLPEEPKLLPPKPHFPSQVEQPVAQDYSSHNAGIVLNPELIATLASWLPTNSQSTVPPVRPPLPPNKPTHPPGLQHLGNSNQFSHQGQTNFSQLQSYPPLSSTPTHSGHQVVSSNQFPDSGNHNNYSVVPSQAGEMRASSFNQQYHHVDASEIYNPSSPRQHVNPGTMPGHSYSANSVQPQNSMSVAPDKVNLQVSNQAQKVQSAFVGAGQGSSEGEGDKNQRYQSTLQFAANLLLQIQQQQVGGAQVGRGSGNQQ